MQAGDALPLRIGHYRDPCWSSGPAFCLRVLESSDPTVAMPQRIEGFEHDWGYVYEIVVDIHELDISPADAPGEHYELVEVIGREAVAADARFDLVLTADYVARVDDEGFDLVGNVAVDCEDASVCASVAESYGRMLHSPSS